ncbi:hypothetical protein [Vagococcus lutrae]|uniref:hypothetical protein n=1 Tax=Vagococcus lutrae TaxID=81947 RepID=UPI00288E9164|nr:hypothetical protein [Vagococcus lutrae]MDT2808396.1 hypothetical protein [Vagococcus lutrae]
MSLINRTEPKDPVVEQSADVDRIITIENLNVKDRKNIKVAPEAFRAIKIIAANQDMKMYELIDELLNNYMKNNMTERERRTILNTIKDTKIKR